MILGYIGLGKMGLAQVARLVERGWRVVAWNRSPLPRKEARRLGADASTTYEDVCRKLKPPRLLWLMVPHTAVDDVLNELLPHLEKSDTVIDGGNSLYRDSMRRARVLGRKGIHFLDVGVSGGPSGAREGACLMVGGDKKIFEKNEKLFKDLSRPTYSILLKNNRIREVGGNTQRPAGSYAYVGGSGAGHFVKMVHNGIEYGMMQAIAEGFALLRDAERRGIDADGCGKKKFGLNLADIARLYNQGSVIESRLVGWLAKAYKEHGEDVRGISGEVAQSGEGLWTVETAKELGVPVKVIESALEFRLKSKGSPSYTGQVISALRNQFGGHNVRAKGGNIAPRGRAPR